MLLGLAIQSSWCLTMFAIPKWQSHIIQPEHFLQASFMKTHYIHDYESIHMNAEVTLEKRH